MAPHAPFGALRRALWFMALALGVASLWTLSEQDIFWQVRAGYELLRTGRWPEVDTWSYSAAGQPWLNIQWLSTVLFATVHAAAGEAGLVILRAVLVTLLIGTCGECVARACQGASATRVGIVSAATVSLCAAGLLPRLQLRSDLLVLLVFAQTLLLWLRDTTDLRRRRLLTVAAVGLAANLHMGTAPFVVALAGVLLVGEGRRWQTSAAHLAATLAAFFATPYTYRPLPMLWAHVFYYDHSLMQNPDHQPLTWAYVATAHGLAYLVTIGLGLAAYTWLRPHRAEALPTIFRGPLAPLLLGVLSLMACDRVRVIPYLLVFALPVLAAGLARVPWHASIALGGLGGTLCVAGLMHLAPTWGFGVNSDVFPVGSTRFVRAVRPAPNIMHTFAYGAYLVWYLRDYPLYVDTRETMFWPLQQEVLGAYYSPEIAHAVARKYGVKTVMMPIPQTRYVPGVGFDDLLASYLPSTAWALVYFDKISFVMLARVPEHDAIIAAHEYKHLRPNLPANSYLHRRDRTPRSDAEYAVELQRCRADEPDSVYCLVAQASWWRATEPNRPIEEAVALLERAQALCPKRGTHYLTLMVELQQAYRAAHREVQAAAIDAALGPSTVVSADSEN